MTTTPDSHVSLPAKTAFSNADKIFEGRFWNDFIDPYDYTKDVPPPQWNELMSDVGSFVPMFTTDGELTTGYAEIMSGYFAKVNAAVNTPATRTVYMDSNIALTDGSAKLGDTETPPHVIPNLYEAIVGLHTISNEIDERVHSIEMGNENSTADKGLFVAHSDNKFTITAGNGFDANVFDNKATAALSTATLNFTASAIEFTVDAKDDVGAPTTRTYNLAAIIEAIQELNRRTMFMDTDAPFLSGVYFADDTTDTLVSAAIHQGTQDYLPGARVQAAVNSADP